jgi:hypothetical protein
MNTNLLPRQPVGSEDTGREDDHVASETPAANVNTNPASAAGDDSAPDEPEWYPPPDTACM